MLYNYFKMAFRSLNKNKIISSINIFGLAVGIAFATIIFMWVDDEISFDNFHQNKDNIYRVVVQIDKEGEYISKTPGLLAAAIKNEIPEVKYATRILQNMRNPYKYEKKAFYEDKSYCVDSDFFKMFSFNLLDGNSKEIFKNPNDIIISNKTAYKYFGNENPIGKTLTWNNWGTYIVSGVMKDMPNNSSIEMNLLEPHTLTEKYWEGGYNWRNYIHETYIMTKKNTSIKPIVEKIEKMLNDNKDIGNHYASVILQPFEDIHLNSQIPSKITKTTDSVYISIFSLIAIGILLIACINFVNISTATALKRAKEVGIRKVIGAERKRLVFQFISEFSVFTFIGALLAILVIIIVLPSFNQFAGKNLSFNYTLIGYFLLIVISTAFIAGAYPAFYLSGFLPNEIFKNKIRQSNRLLSWQSVLVVFQFSISIFLIISTLIVNSQLSFIQNKNLGFAKDNILYIPAKAKLAENYENVKNRLMQNPNITGVTMQSAIATTTLNTWLVHWYGSIRDRNVVGSTEVTNDYFETMGIELDEGRFFLDKLSSDKNQAFILNKSAVDYLQMKSPVGTEITAGGRKGKIIGVVKDSYFKSLHHKIEPLIFAQLQNYNEIDLFGVILVKYSGNSISQIISEAENIWQEFNSELPFEYHFLDQTIERQYAFEQKLKVTFSWFSIFTITISVLGLLGLTILYMEQRVKEIGIRKVLGASVNSLLLLLFRNFMTWILIANIIAWPVAYYFMKKWLQDFAYRIDLTILPFLLSGLLALIITLITISFQAIKASRANPVDSLRNE